MDNFFKNRKGGMLGLVLLMIGILFVIILIFTYLSTLPRGPSSAFVWGITLFLYGYILFGKVLLKGEDTKIAVIISLMPAILVAVGEMIPENMLLGLQQYLGNPRMAIMLLYTLITIVVLVYKGLKPVATSDATKEVYQDFFGSPVREAIKKGGKVSFAEDTKKDLKEALEKNSEGFDEYIQLISDLGQVPRLWYGSSGGNAPAINLQTPSGGAQGNAAQNAIGNVPANILALWNSQAPTAQNKTSFREGMVAPAYNILQFLKGIKDKTDECLNDSTRKRAINQLYNDYYVEIDPTLRKAYDSLRQMRDADDTRLEGIINDSNTPAADKNHWITIKDGLSRAYNNLMDHIAGTTTANTAPPDLDTRAFGLTLAKATRNVVWSASAIEAKDTSQKKVRDIVSEISFKHAYSTLTGTHKDYVDKVAVV